MPADLVDDDNPALARVARKTTPAAALAALGIVYGDLGTSPLYTLQSGRWCDRRTFFLGSRARHSLIDILGADHHHFR